MGYETSVSGIQMDIILDLVQDSIGLRKLGWIKGSQWRLHLSTPRGELSGTTQNGADEISRIIDRFENCDGIGKAPWLGE